MDATLTSASKTHIDDDLLERLMALPPAGEIQLKALGRRNWLNLQKKAWRRNLEVKRLDLAGKVYLAIRQPASTRTVKESAIAPLTRDDEETRFAATIAADCKARGIHCPTWSQVLSIIRGMGYRLPYERN